jgi:Lactoylglutathione lyase and related lyases
MIKISNIILSVRNFDEAIKFYTQCLGFQLIADNIEHLDFRWVTISPQKQNETTIVLVEENTTEKLNSIGIQAIDYVFMSIITDNCEVDYQVMKNKGVRFFGKPIKTPFGIEVIFEDLYGNKFDLVQPIV